MKKILLGSLILIFGSVLITNAQVTPKATARQGVQQGRIVEGARSGELNRKETRALEAQQRHINRSKKRAKADGDVTAQERAKIARKQNRASKNIAREKRD